MKAFVSYCVLFLGASVAVAQSNFAEQPPREARVLTDMLNNAKAICYNRTVNTSPTKAECISAALEESAKEYYKPEWNQWIKPFPFVMAESTVFSEFSFPIVLPLDFSWNSFPCFNQTRKFCAHVLYANQTSAYQEFVHGTRKGVFQNGSDFMNLLLNNLASYSPTTKLENRFVLSMATFEPKVKKDVLTPLYAKQGEDLAKAFVGLLAKTQSLWQIFDLRSPVLAGNGYHGLTVDQSASDIRITTQAGGLSEVELTYENVLVSSQMPRATVKVYFGLQHPRIVVGDQLLTTSLSNRRYLQEIPRSSPREPRCWKMQKTVTDHFQRQAVAHLELTKVEIFANGEPLMHMKLGANSVAKFSFTENEAYRNESTESYYEACDP